MDADELKASDSGFQESAEQAQGGGGALKKAVESALLSEGLASDGFGSVALTVLGASNLELVDLDGVEALERLQKLDVSRNKLVSLSELAGLSELREVDASNNLLQNALDFGAPLCNNEKKTIVSRATNTN